MLPINALTLWLCRCLATAPSLDGKVGPARPRDLFATTWKKSRTLGLTLAAALLTATGPACAQFSFQYQTPNLTAGDMFSIGLRTDGTLMATGLNNYGQCNIVDWSNIVMVAASSFHTVGLRANGTVVAAGRNDSGQCNVAGLNGIVLVAPGYYHTLAARSNGTVVSIGAAFAGQGNVAGWRDIVGLAAGSIHSLGVKADGTVVAAGSTNDGKLEVGGWRSIVSLAAGSDHSVGLQADGTVVAVGRNNLGQCNVQTWTNIVQISALSWQTLGVTATGIVRSTGENNWGQQAMNGRGGGIAVAAGEHFSIALRPDGTLFHAGANEYGQRYATNWNLGNTPTNGFTLWGRNLRLPAHRRVADHANGSLQMPNLLAYALGLDPNQAQPSDLPYLIAGSAGTVRFVFRSSTNAIDANLEAIEASALPGGEWSPVSLPQVLLGDTPDGQAELWAIDLPAIASQGYLRLRASQR